MSHAGFDEYADDYESALNRGIAASGEGRGYFARGRIDWLRRCLEGSSPLPRAVMDYGCGTGESVRLLQEAFGAARAIGADLSETCLTVARRNCDDPRVSFIGLADEVAPASIDLVYTNGTFHHIPTPERPAALAWISRVLSPRGLLALWENNPWNPGTRYVMRRIPFDRDAVPLSVLEATRLVKAAGFEVLRRDFLFLFPRALRPLRVLEAPLAPLPLGAQYQLLCRKRGR